MRDKESQFLYQSTTEEIRFKKNRQWQAAAYYSAVTAFFIVQYNSLAGVLGVIYGIPVIKLLFLLGSIYYVWLLLHDIEALKEERRVLKKIYKTCGKRFEYARSHKEKVTKFDCGDKLVFWGYIFLVIISNFILWAL